MIIKKLVEVGDACDAGIFPQALETVELACLALEDVDEEVSVVDGYPLAVLQSHDALTMMARLVLDMVNELVGDAQHVGGGGAFADHEILECGFLEIAHVDDLNVAGLAVLKSFDDDVYQFVCHLNIFSAQR